MSLVLVLLFAIAALFGYGKIPAGERGSVLVLEQRRVVPNWASGARFSSEIAVPYGLVTGFQFTLSGTTVTDSALNDDAPWTLVSELTITIPLKRGDVVIRSTGRDLYLLARYLTGNLRENPTAATAGVTFSSFFLPLGPQGWGFHSEALRKGAAVIVTGTWGPPTEYGAATTDITTGLLVPAIHVDEAVAPDSGRRCLIPVTTRIPIESESRFPRQRLNKPELSDGLFAVLYRNEDASAAGDRVDGIVTRLVLNHSKLGDLHDQFYRDLRGVGLEWAGISPAEVTAALPLGLDGTAFFPSAPRFTGFADLTRADLQVTVDCVETVQAGATNVANAAGDACHATVVAEIIPGF